MQNKYWSKDSLQEKILSLEDQISKFTWISSFFFKKRKKVLEGELQFFKKMYSRIIDLSVVKKGVLALITENDEGDVHNK